jgi:hypothetical protein
MRTWRTKPLGWMIVAAVLGLSSAPAGAALLIVVPGGMHVGLEFLTPVYTQTARNGDKVNFQVAADVVVDRYVVIKQGTPVTGTVMNSTGPGRFGRPSMVTIGYLTVTAVDHKPVVLNAFKISPSDVAGKRLGAAAAMTAGVMLTKSAWGLLGGALVKGNDVVVPVHSVMGVTTQTAVTVTIH